VLTSFITINSLTNTWIEEWKCCFVAAWTNSYCHYGQVTSSRAESGHAYLKKIIDTSTGSLLGVFTKIDNALLVQVNEIKETWNVERAKNILSLAFKPIYANVLKKVSKYALLKVHQAFVQFQVAVSNGCGTTCTGVFSRTIGLPCPHTMNQLLQLNLSLNFTHFSTQWWIVDRMPFQEVTLTNFSLDSSIETIENLFPSLPPHSQLNLIENLNSWPDNSAPSVYWNPTLSVVQEAAPRALSTEIVLIQVKEETHHFMSMLMEQ
jgi:hypothetical protein